MQRSKNTFMTKPAYHLLKSNNSVFFCKNLLKNKRYCCPEKKFYHKNIVFSISDQRILLLRYRLSLDCIWNLNLFLIKYL